MKPFKEGDSASNKRYQSNSLQPSAGISPKETPPADKEDKKRMANLNKELGNKLSNLEENPQRKFKHAINDDGSDDDDDQQEESKD